MSALTRWLKRAVQNTPLEGAARWLYLRLDPTPGGLADRETLAVMERCIQARTNCVDIGAHRGALLQEMVARAPQGQHWAFEPLPEHAAYLRRAFPQVQVFPLALSNVRGTATFDHVPSRPTRSSLRAVPGAGTVQQITVETDLLDNVLPPTAPVQFIKIDVEGAEYQVLQGARRSLQRHRPIVVFEHTRLAETCFGAQSAELYALLHAADLRVSRLGAWLAGQAPLGCAEFVELVKTEQAQYFMAHP